MKNKILKWFIPVISYFVYLGFGFLWSEIDVWVFGQREDLGGGPLPPFPDSFMFLLALPLIPWGYILLAIAQRLYKKNRKYFKRFAWILTMASIILVLILYICNSTSGLLYFLLVDFPTILFYYVPFFLGLSYVFKKNIRTPDVNIKK